MLEVFNGLRVMKVESIISSAESTRTVAASPSPVPTGNEKQEEEDAELQERTALFIKSLKVLCYYLFAKQFLMRYGSHAKPQSKVC